MYRRSREPQSSAATVISLRGDPAVCPRGPKRRDVYRADRDHAVGPARQWTPPRVDASRRALPANQPVAGLPSSGRPRRHPSLRRLRRMAHRHSARPPLSPLLLAVFAVLPHVAARPPLPSPPGLTPPCSFSCSSAWDRRGSAPARDYAGASRRRADPAPHDIDVRVS